MDLKITGYEIKESTELCQVVSNDFGLIDGKHTYFANVILITSFRT